MDVRHLRQVMEICRSGSFARAAQALGLSQPALSRSIARLEDELGVSLFDRAGGATKPTMFGLHVAERGADVLGEVESIEREVRRLFTGQAGRLSLGVGGGVVKWVETSLLPPLLARFPELALTIHQERASLLADLLAARQVDLVIAHADGITDRPDLVRLAWLELEIAYLVRPGHPATGFPTPIARADLLVFPFAMQSVTAELLRQLPANLSPEQHENLRAYTAQTFGMLTQICRLTDAVMIAPVYPAADPVAAGLLERLEVEPPRDARAVLAVNAEGLHSPVLREVIDMVRRTWPGPVREID